MDRFELHTRVTDLVDRLDMLLDDLTAEDERGVQVQGKPKDPEQQGHLDLLSKISFDLRTVHFGTGD
jgi:hypothetical protein